MVSRLVLMLLVTGLLSACTSPAVMEPAPPPASVPANASTSTLPQNNASSGLIDRARAARLAGDYDEASGLLQRAQRIDPRNGRVYLEIARLYHDLGDAEGAHTVAERGLLYCQPGTCRELREQL